MPKQTNPVSLITDNINIWSSAIQNKKGVGRGSSKKINLYGIKKLRELILELAVRGLLVEQNPDDELASVLLDKISNQKKQLINKNIIKKQKTLPPVTEEEKPFDLPEGWALERIGNLTEKLGSGSTPRGGKAAYVDEGIPFLRSQNIWNDGLKLNDIAYIPHHTHDKMENTKVYPSDVLLNITGASLGRSTIFPEELIEANVSQHVTIIRLIEQKMAQFVHLGILSPMVQKLVWGRQVGMAIEGLSKKVLEMFEFPIPPLEEQKRIVTKVNELMTLCDQLEQQQENSITAHKILVETLLAALTNAANKGDFDQAWKKIADHFDTLFTTEHSIDQLKQTILQLAVMGKLVPQNPKDEPAGIILEKIEEENERLIKEKIIKKRKPLPDLDDAEKPFELPVGWEWCRINQLLMGDTQNGISTKADEKPEGIPLFRISAGTTRSDYIVNEAEYKLASNISEDNQHKFSLEHGDLLAVRFNGNKAFVGRMSVFQNLTRITSVYPDKLIRIRLFKYLVSPYLVRYFFNSANIREILENYCATTVGNWGISAKNLKTVPIPIPPLLEQHRIVAKVDELIALCDTLKSHINTAQTTQLHLADAMAEQAIS